MPISVGDDVIKVFSEPLRARILELLAEGPACTCHLVNDTGAKQPTVSHHLRILREAGLVETEPYRQFTYYRLLPDAIEQVAGQLTELAARARQNADSRREC